MKSKASFFVRRTYLLNISACGKRHNGESQYKHQFSRYGYYFVKQYVRLFIVDSAFHFFPLVYVVFMIYFKE